MKYCIHFQELNEQIAHLKDQLQELKAKTGLEEKFLKKSTQVKLHYDSNQCTLCAISVQATVEIAQHKLDTSTSGLESSKQDLEQKLTEEKTASQAILDYLNKHYNVLNLIFMKMSDFGFLSL